MRKKSEIVKMRVMDMLNGAEAGKVQNIVIHPDTKAVVMLLNVGPITEFHMLRSNQIIGINDFIMIKTPSAVANTSEDAKALAELSEYYDIVGLDVVADDGCRLGVVEDFSLDEVNLRLDEIQLENGMKFNRSDVLSITNEFVFVHREIEEEPPITAHFDIDDATSYILGKKLAADIASEDGMFSCEAGTVITEGIVELAKEHNSFADLIISVEE